MGVLAQKKPCVDFTDDEARMDYVLSTLERRKPEGLGFAYTSIYRHGRIEVTVHKVVPYDETKRGRKLLTVFAVVDTPEGLRKVHPEHSRVYVKERPVARVVLDPHG